MAGIWRDRAKLSENSQSDTSYGNIVDGDVLQAANANGNQETAVTKVTRSLSTV